MQNTVKFTNSGSTVSTDELSGAVWDNFPIGECIANPRRKGIFRFDDFTDLPLAPTLTTQVAFGKYKAYAASGCTISRVSAINSVELMGGALQIAMDTDDDEASIADAYPSYLLTGNTSNSGLLCMEFCYTQNSIATNMAATFFGLCEVEQYTLGANTPMNSGDAIANSGSMIGFRIEEDGLGVVDTVVSDRATSFTNIGDTEGGTIAAHTFVKYGMVYDPTKGADCITFYINNAKCATKYSKTTLQALTNLDANALGLMWAVAADSGGTSFLGSMRWWAIGQILPGNTWSSQGS